MANLEATRAARVGVSGILHPRFALAKRNHPQLAMSRCPWCAKIESAASFASARTQTPLRRGFCLPYVDPGLLWLSTKGYTFGSLFRVCRYSGIRGCMSRGGRASRERHGQFLEAPSLALFSELAGAYVSGCPVPAIRRRSTSAKPRYPRLETALFQA